MTNSLSSQTLKVMNIILKPYEKNSSEQFSYLLSQVPSKEERIFLSILSIMLGSPNCINHSLVYISFLINKKEEHNSASSRKTNKTSQDPIPDTNSLLPSDSAIITPTDIPNCLPPEMIISFWTNLSFFYRSKKDSTGSHIHLASFIDLIPTFYNETILESLLTPKNCSFLVINYIQKLKDKNISKLSEHIIENCSDDQIKLFIPFIVSNESSSKVIETWITEHIYEHHENNYKYETALTAALSSYQCVTLQPTTIDLMIINFFNGKFSINSEIFESFLFYIQRKVRIFDRNKFSTKEDFLMTFFSSFIKIRPNLFKSEIVCPNMFTKMANSKIRIPPFSLSLYFSHLDDFLLKYIAKQFIFSRSYIIYIKRCYEKSMKINPNSFSRKVLDYSIMALFLKTTDINSNQYPIVIEMAGKIKMPRDEFANLVFMQIIRMFSNPIQRNDAMKIIENWKKDDLSKITKLLLVVFNTKNINALVNAEEIICKRGGHALTALFNLTSTYEFCQSKTRKALLVTVIERIVSKIDVSRLKPRKYMQAQLHEIISCNMSKNDEFNSNIYSMDSKMKPNSPPRSPSKSRLKSRTHSFRKDEDKDNDDGELNSPPRSPSKSRLRLRTHSFRKDEDENGELNELNLPPRSPSKSRLRSRTHSSKKENEENDNDDAELNETNSASKSKLKSSKKDDDDNKLNETNSTSKSKLKSRIHSNKKEGDDDDDDNELNETNLAPKMKVKSRIHSSKKEGDDDESNELNLNSKAKSRNKIRTMPPSELNTKLRIKSKHESDSESNSNSKSAKSKISDENCCCNLTNDNLVKFLVSQISSKNSSKIEISEVVKKIVTKIESLDRRHSKHHHSKSGKSNANSHKNSKETETNKNEEEEAKTIKKNDEPIEKKENENNIEIIEKENSEDDKIQKNDISQKNNDDEIEEEINDDQIELNDTNKTNQSLGLYNVVGSVMKMLFGFRSSQNNNNEETNKKQSYRSSLPISTTKIDETGKKNDVDENEKRIPTPSSNILSTAKTQPLFEEEIEISSDGVMAFPDEDYSSSSESDYSDINISDFSLEISDNEIPMI